ncbi:DUF2955 domain-containing protein [Skermanella aerolata]|uniref:DUF2955 domain-containing protein n=1 Tax=Skermanella aerolata TaxID=393310 RepID=UPI0005C97B59|nr:DUF2955 domain-containing protein [Skermanella aerolata]KJB96831.1 membrane protein [Skermanella aerolata KACC 11604]
MSTDTGGRRQGLRIAFAVAASFTTAVAQGEVIPFLGAVFATQFLMASRRPMGVPQGIGFVAVIVLAGYGFMLLTSILGNRPTPYLLMLGLIYFACFLAQLNRRGGPAPGLILIIGVAAPLLGVLDRDLGASVVVILGKAAANGVLFAWLAHVAFPDQESADSRPLPPQHIHRQATRIAFANTVILLVIFAFCVADDDLSTAVVLPLTVVSLLGQIDLVTSPRAAAGLVIVNLLGGIVASISFTILRLWPELFWLFLIVLTVGLIFGGLAAANVTTGKLYAGALITFLILFGLGVSPLPGSSAEAFSTRIAYVLAAVVYTILMAAVLWPARPDLGSAEVRHPVST